MNLHNLFLQQILLLAIHVQVRSTGAPASKSTIPDVLNDLHSKVAVKKPQLMGAINAYRAKICADMKNDHGLKFSSHEACNDFMKRACHPGRDQKMDGDAEEVTTGQGHCKAFFNADLNKAAEEEHRTRTNEAHEQKAKASSIDGKDGKAGATAAESRDRDREKHEVSDAHSKEETGTRHAGAPPSPAGAGGAPAPAGSRPTVGDTVVILDTKNTQDVFPRGISKEFVIRTDRQKNKQPYQVDGSRVWLHEGDVLLVGKRAISEDEKWYFKNGGIDEGRFHMDEELKLPAQGYWGKMVEHDDGKTSTGDWGKEFTPLTGSSERRKICEKHPESMWCQERFGSPDDRPRRSTAAVSTIGHSVFAFVLAFNFICAPGSY